MKFFNKFLILVVMVSLAGLYSCGKNDTSTTDTKTEGKTSSSSDSKSESSGNKDLGINSDFTIKYEITGKVKGDITTYKKGKKVKQDMVMDVNGMKMKTNNYIGDKYVYNVMDVMGKKMGTKIDISKYKEEGGKEGKDIDYSDMAGYLKDKKKVGTETILGKECDIYETGKGVTISVTKEMIPLRIKTEPMTMTAVSLELKADVPDSEMDAPTDIEYTDMSSITNKYKK